jgi:hypothetical protein
VEDRAGRIGERLTARAREHQKPWEAAQAAEAPASWEVPRIQVIRPADYPPSLAKTIQPLTVSDAPLDPLDHQIIAVADHPEDMFGHPWQ